MLFQGLFRRRIKLHDVPLATSYNQSYLVSLVKNTNWVYVFWELANDDLAAAIAKLDTITWRKVLRISCGSALQRTVVMDLSIEANVGSHYVYLVQSGQQYQMELVLLGEQESVVLLSSSWVETPPGVTSSSQDQQWAAIDELYTRYATEVGNQHHSSPHKWQISSPMGQQLPVKTEDDIQLTIDTELVIYGRATPGAIVFIKGEPIQTVSDGSFSLRYALSDGTGVYPIKAVSFDGNQTKTIVPIITRETY